MSRPLADYTPYESDEEVESDGSDGSDGSDESGTEDEYVAEEDPNELRRIRQARDSRYALIRAPADGPLLSDEPLPAIKRVLTSNIINTPTGAVMTGAPGVTAPVTGAIKNVTVDRKAVTDAAYAQAQSKSLNLSQQSRTRGSLANAPFFMDKSMDTTKDMVYLDPPKTVKTSLFSLKSSNRDKQVYPTPYNFQIKLPRVYKNVTKFQLVQLSFPNSAANLSQTAIFTSSLVSALLEKGIPSTCISTCINVMNCTTQANTLGLIEAGRVNDVGDPLLVTLSLSDGMYNNKQIAQELTTKANRTPPFNLITYEAFRDVFVNTRDILVLFNEPGDSFESDATLRRLGTHTKEDIMNTYYSQQHVDSFPIITETIAFNAYYYPILKEVLATQRALPFLQVDPSTTFDDVYQQVMGSFLGLDSVVYEQICRLNQGALDVYRRHLTFELRNVNKYIWSYSDSDRRFRSVHDTLHPSLQREFKRKYADIVGQQLAAHGLQHHSVPLLKKDAVGYASIYKHLEMNLSTVLHHYHMVSGYRYQGGLEHHTTESTFHAVSDLHADEAFTTMFAYQSTIGRIYGNYGGTGMTFTNFLDYHSSLSGYYDLHQSVTQTLSSFHGHVQADYHDYVSTKYTGILPDQTIQTQTYTSQQSLPVSFITNQTLYLPGQSVRGLAQATPEDCSAICCAVIQDLVNSWYSCLPVDTAIRGLNYRMGLMNQTIGHFNLLSSIADITSTGNTNFFIQMNTEFGFNNMDIGMKENYAISNETTGQVKLMAAKILMGAVGDTGLSQTVIQNPVVLDVPLGKLDHLEFKIYYDDDQLTPAWQYLPFTLEINEWNATFQIDEEVSFANRETGWGQLPTIPIPNDPRRIAYLGLTSKDNPNNNKT
jgi:hypothetical protein